MISYRAPFSAALVTREQARGWQNNEGESTAGLRGVCVGRRVETLFPACQPLNLSHCILRKEMGGNLCTLPLSLEILTPGSGSGSLLSLGAVLRG